MDTTERGTTFDLETFADAQYVKAVFENKLPSEYKNVSTEAKPRSYGNQRTKVQGTNLLIMTNTSALEAHVAYKGVVHMKISIDDHWLPYEESKMVPIIATLIDAANYISEQQLPTKPAVHLSGTTDTANSYLQRWAYQLGIVNRGSVWKLAGEQ